MPEKKYMPLHDMLWVMIKSKEFWSQERSPNFTAMQIAAGGIGPFYKTDRDDRFEKDLKSAKEGKRPDLELMEQIAAAQNDKSEEARDFLKMVQVVGAALDDRPIDFSRKRVNAEVFGVFMGLIDKGKKSGLLNSPEQLKKIYDILVGTTRGTRFHRPVLIERANSPLATTGDVYDLVDDLSKDKNKDIGQLEKLANDIHILARKEIGQELAKDVPDLELIKESAGSSTGAYYKISNMLMRGDKKEEVDAVISEIKKEFDMDKLLNVGGADYLQRFEKDAVEQNIALAEEIKALKAGNQKLEDEKKKSEKEHNLRAERLEKDKNALLDEIKELKTELAATEGSLSEEKQTVKKFQDATKELRIGIGSRGVNKVKNIASGKMK